MKCISRWKGKQKTKKNNVTQVSILRSFEQQIRSLAARLAAASDKVSGGPAIGGDIESSSMLAGCVCGACGGKGEGSSGEGGGEVGGEVGVA